MHKRVQSSGGDSRGAHVRAEPPPARADESAALELVVDDRLSDGVEFAVAAAGGVTQHLERRVGIDTSARHDDALRLADHIAAVDCMAELLLLGPGPIRVLLQRLEKRIPLATHRLMGYGIRCAVSVGVVSAHNCICDRAAAGRRWASIFGKLGRWEEADLVDLVPGEQDVVAGHDGGGVSRRAGFEKPVVVGVAGYRDRLGGPRCR